MTEAVVVVCPNPKCRREIEEPILLTIRSVTPTKQYEACPYCFAKLEPEPPLEQEQEIVLEPAEVEHEEIMEEGEEAMSNLSVNSVLDKVKGSGPRFLKKVKALIPNSKGPQKEKPEKIEEPQAKPSRKEMKVIKEEPKTESYFTEEETEEAPKLKLSDEKEPQSSGCPHTFGYLAKRPKDTPIPQQCMLCPKIVDCMLKLD